MSRQSSILLYRGKIGKKVGVKRDNKYYERSLPEQVSQTENTRKAARRFGQASHVAAFIRKAFYPYLPVVPDGEHVNRLTTLLSSSGGEHIAAIIGYRFNKNVRGAGKVIAVTIDFHELKVLSVIVGDHQAALPVPEKGTMIVVLGAEIVAVKSTSGPR